MRPQRRKHGANSSSTKCAVPHSRAHETPASHRAPRAKERLEPRVRSAAQHCGHTAAFSCSCPSDSSTDLPERHLSRQAGGLSIHDQEDSNTDLSEGEKDPVSPCSGVPPKLELRPEVIKDGESSLQIHRSKRHGTFEFPDFLPPPLNSWNLSQLAVFYKMEDKAASRLRPVGPLERYLERLLQLEWHQMQTVQEERGESAPPESTFTCYRAPTTASARLSSPKCILQCQRAFLLTFLSSLGGHPSLLSGCTCTVCQMKYSNCTAFCCRSYHSRQSGPPSMLERSHRSSSLAKRSSSESRPSSSDRSCRAPRFNSPVRTSSHMKRMQASGNIRNPNQGATTRSHSTVRDSADSSGRGPVSDGKMGVLWRSTDSEHRRGGADRPPNRSEERRSFSECRKTGGERSRAAGSKKQQTKADSTTGNTKPKSKRSQTCKPSRTRLVEFVI
ncbi:protein FAM217B [Oryzias latipes]|uniref:Uncharacterized protein n=1 Tax=Oryzias latipes TaxID=8090 RepID=A0A3B3HUT2_ORYLA|nr:protein FAM217B [Oryzias latipes]XP_011473488.1 protein FAM217B [Oryzias latipes]XP_011473489.1 protein FAM217B [Oryzias latipes]XP_020558970.1 protein FAM217B [Oryzias latipes]XP_020558971.1 protein FAM217B [Oryzias latipes]